MRRRTIRWHFSVSTSPAVLLDLTQYSLLSFGKIPVMAFKSQMKMEMRKMASTRVSHSTQHTRTRLRNNLLPGIAILPIDHADEGCILDDVRGISLERIYAVN
jgi:hypothetical protein